MGIVAEACLRLTLSLGCGVRAKSRLFARGTGDRGLCGAVASISGARTIGIQIGTIDRPRGAGAGIAVRRTQSTVIVSGNIMTCHRRMAVGNRSVARLRSAAWCHSNRDRWRSQQR